MLKTVDEILSPKLFQILLLIATALTLVPVVHYAYGGYVKYLLVLGFIICIWQLIRKNLLTSINDSASIVVLCFALFYLVSIILNRGIYFGANIKQLVYMVLFFLLLFMNSKKSDLHQMEIKFSIISLVVIILTFFLSLISFLLFMLNISEWYYFDSEVIYVIGSIDSKFWGLYNPNTCGAISVISIVASLYLLSVNRFEKKFLKIVSMIFLAVNMVLQYVMLTLSESRGAYYSFLGVSIVALFIVLMKNFNPGKMKLAFRVFVSVVLCVALLFGLMLCSTVIQNNKDVLCTVSSEDANDPSLDTGFENSLENIIKEYASKSSAFAGLFKVNNLAIGNQLSNAIGRDERAVSDTTGRTTIWKAGFNVFLKSPVFGWTREGLVEPVCEVVEASSEYDTSGIVGGGLHNIYLTVLCASGIVGFICFAILIVIVMIRFLKNLIKSGPISYEMLFSFLMCLYFFVSELVEARILYTVSFFNVVFWIYFGYLNYFSLKGNEVGEEKV